MTLVDLVSEPPVVLDTIDSGVWCVQELDIAPDDSFGIATGSRDGLVSKFTLEPFEVLPDNPAGPWVDALFGGSTQDVHINSNGTVAVQPMFQAGFLAVVDVTQDIPELLNLIPSPTNPDSPDDALHHHGISLSQWDDDTILATGTPSLLYITVASLSGLFESIVLPTPGRPESVDITCDGTRAVVETSEGLMWIDLEATPPMVLNDNFGPARTDNNSTSTVAFSADGTLLFVAGYVRTGGPGTEASQIDVYDATMDPPVLMGTIPFDEGSKIETLATLPCSAAPSDLKAPSEIKVAVDIKPRKCPNRLNVRNNRMVPVAILGSENLDVRNIDPETIQLEGVSPRHWKVRDVATPYDDDTMQGDCRDCTKKGRDGYPDLILKFKNRQIVKAIGPARELKHGDCLVLTLTGETFAGTPIFGDDVVRIIKKKKKKISKKKIKKWLYYWLKEIKTEKKGKICNIVKKTKPVISKAKPKWHRKYKRH